jgi:glucose/arabinose dehydrogenase
MRHLIRLLCLWLAGTVAAQCAESPPDRGVRPPRPPAFASLYQGNCAVCHGEDLRGAAQAGPLIGVELPGGDSVEAIAASISRGNPDTGMPSWKATFSQEQIRQLAIFVAETRAGMVFSDFRVGAPFELPLDPVDSKRHRFQLEPVIEGLDRYPYSIAALPDGRILLTEKTRGLTIVSTLGVQSSLIEGAPIGHAMHMARDTIQFGTGYLMDVALHPNYANNGWIYLHHGHQCLDCAKPTRRRPSPASMNRLIRGRIKDGHWVDEQTIWSARREHYTTNTEMAAGGRIAFDPDGFVFISVGMKAGYEGIQDLRFPYGKIHRVHDDGRIPLDNPFIDVGGAIKSTWTYGHRSPQGLEFDPAHGLLWGTEMGPRGGDEVNLLKRGRNYGWPLFSKGIHYNGNRVGTGIVTELTLADIEQPVVDLTPGPAVSSLVIYQGDAFPAWRGNLLVGTLKGTELYRIEVKDGRLVSRETLLGPLARIRDIEVEPDGNVLLLLEHRTESQIVRMTPTRGPDA